MKSKISVLLVSAILLLGTGCTDLYDDNWNLFLTKDYVPQTQEDIDGMLAAPYVDLRKSLLYTTFGMRLMEITSDQSVIPARPTGWVDGGIYRVLHEHKWTSEHGHISEVWNFLYSGIGKCNFVLHQINTGMIPLGDDKDAIIAENKVLRAMYYYLLCDFFGNVPIETEYEHSEENYLPTQSTRKEVFDFIIKEVKDNINFLSDENGGNMYGRVNKWTAHTLLAKMYLNAEVYTGTARWQDCINECDEVIKSGKFNLDPKQIDVFKRDNHTAQEMIYAFVFEFPNTNASNVEDFSIHYQTQAAGGQFAHFVDNWAMWGPGWNGICAIPQFINTFDQDDERYKKNWFMGLQRYAPPLNEWYGQEFCTLSDGVTPLEYVNVVNSIAHTEENQGYRHAKFTIEQPQYTRDNDFPFFRYADVLMMKSEALLRSDRANDAAAIVTEVRTRNFEGDFAKGGKFDKATVTGAQLQAGSVYDYGRRDVNTSSSEGGSDVKFGRMLDELGWEFNQEARRRQDMIRFGVFTSKSWFSHDKSKKYCELFPIPRNEVQKNKNIKQNPGYDGVPE